MLKPPKIVFLTMVALMIAPFAVILLLFALIFARLSPDWKSRRDDKRTKEERQQAFIDARDNLYKAWAPFWQHLKDWVNA